MYGDGKKIWNRMFAIAILICFVRSALAEKIGPGDLEAILSRAYDKNPEVHAAEAEIKSREGEVKINSWLPDPKLGVMHEKGMTLLQRTQGPIDVISFSQEVLFPSKYFLLNSAKSARAQASRHDLKDRLYEIRGRVLSSIYASHVAQESLYLLTAQKQTLAEISRVAETKRSAGLAPIQDEMKAHLEQTRLETEILVKEQDLVDRNSALDALLGQESRMDSKYNFVLSTPKVELASPEALLATALENSPALKSQSQSLVEAQKEKSISYLSYAPDFMLSARKMNNMDLKDAYAIGVEFTIPLWFFERQTGEVQRASANEMRAQAELTKTQLNLRAQIHSLHKKVKNSSELLKIYETSLIPQAQATMNMARSNYSAGRATFLDLLVAERDVYAFRLERLSTLMVFVENITSLERLVGARLSDLPAGDRL